MNSSLREVLEPGRRPRAPRLDVDRREVDTVDEDPPPGRRVEPVQQLHDRRLARTVLADERDDGARGQVEGDVLQHLRIQSRVREIDVVEVDAVLETGRRRARGGRGALAVDVVEQPAEASGVAQRFARPRELADALRHHLVHLAGDGDRHDDVARRRETAHRAQHDEHDRADEPDREERERERVQDAQPPAQAHRAAM